MGKRFFLPMAIAVVVVIVAAYLISGVHHLQENANRMTCAGKLKQLGYGLLNFQEIYGCLPPAYIADEHGTPMHSWRVLMLEVMDHEDVYRRYDFSEPWNGPHNAQLADGCNLHGRTWLQCPSEDRADPMWTSYLAVVGKGTLWPGEMPGQVTPAAASKILLVEVANSGIHWMEPRDLTVEPAPAGPTLDVTPSSRHPIGIQFVTAADDVRILPKDFHARALSDMLFLDTAPPAAATEPEPAQAMRQFLNCAVSRVPFLRLRAAQMLAQFRRQPGKFVPRLRQAVNDERQEIRAAAVDALDKIDAKRQK